MTTFLLLVVVGLFGIAALVSLLTVQGNYNNEASIDTIHNAMVVTMPKELKAGIYIMEVEVESQAKEPTRLQAITSHPEQFHIGDACELSSIITSPKAAFRDMFYIAVKPDAKGVR